ncbi:hypothetical protein J6590_069827 [Homalodisca vitripennis]|nr:hypothetical protein J6590_069827 [Homalodisca vitripennis]
MILVFVADDEHDDIEVVTPANSWRDPSRVSSPTLRISKRVPAWRSVGPAHAIFHEGPSKGYRLRRSSLFTTASTNPRVVAFMLPSQSPARFPLSSLS